MTDAPKIKSFNVSFGTGSLGAPAEESARGPLRIVVLSALSAGAEYSTQAAVAAEPVRVDRLSFDRVMKALGPAFTVEVSDPFSPDGEALKVDLRWPEMKAMRPDGIADQVGALRALVEARKILQQARDGKSGVDDARALLGRILPRAAWAAALAGEVTVRPAPQPASPSPPTKSGGDPLDALFAKVGVKEGGEAGGEARATEPGASPPAGAPSGLSAIVSAVARGGLSAKPRERAAAVVGTAIERAERAFVRILGEVLQHPEVRRLEGTWRGLRLLVDSIDPRLGVEVDVVPVAQSRAADALRGLGEPTGVQATRAPIDLIVLDYDVGASSDEAATLEAWARLAASSHVPCVVNGHAAILGLDTVADLARASKRFANHEDPRPETVRSVAADEACRWVTVAMNGPLVRAAYTASASRLREIAFHEDARDPSRNVFAGPAIAIAVLAARAYVRTGWPCAIVGARDGAVEDLPVHEVGVGGETFAIPLQAFVTEDIVRDAARAGVSVFTCAANHDAALLLRVPTLHKAGTGGPNVTLGDQLFVRRFASALQQVGAALPVDVDSRAGEEAARLALAELFPNAPPSGPEITARIRGDRRLEVTVHPRRYAGIALEEVTLSVPLG